jgi:hypothetical protein
VFRILAQFLATRYIARRLPKITRMIGMSERTLEKKVDEEAARKLYMEILKTANYFLHNAKHFSVEILAEENPTYEGVAELTDYAAKLVYSLADDFDPMMGQKAFEYCLIMKKMGIAIKNKNQDELSRLADELYRRPLK